LRNFLLIATGIDVMPLHHALIRRPDLWNQNTYRTTYAGTPHGDVDDIWLRYSDTERTADPMQTGPVQNDHGAVWYPAAKELPEAKPLILNLMHYLSAYELGRVVISRIKPGGRILPHADIDGDYVHLGDIARYHIVVQGLPGSLFRCGDEQVDMRTGEVWWFDAHSTHEVINNSADDRIHLMADLRKWV
jgi:hypothetical protein